MAQPPPKKPSLRAAEVSAAKWAAIAALITAGSGALKMGYDVLLTKDAPAAVSSDQEYDKPAVEPKVDIPENEVVNPIRIPEFAPPVIRQVPGPFRQATLSSNGKAVRLRRAPNLKAATKRFIEPGETVTVSERIGDWWYVELESGERGYVNAAFLSEPR